MFFTDVILFFINLPGGMLSYYCDFHVTTTTENIQITINVLVENIFFESNTARTVQLDLLSLIFPTRILGLLHPFYQTCINEILKFNHDGSNRSPWRSGTYFDNCVSQHVSGTGSSPAGSVGRDLNLQKLNYQYLTTSVAVVLVSR